MVSVCVALFVVGSNPSAVSSLPPASTPITVSLPPLQPVGGFDQGRADSLLDFFGQRLERTGAWKVTTAAQIAQLLGFDRQRQLLGCEASTCVAELSGALGSEALVTGNIGKVGTAYTVNLKLLDAKNGSTLVSRSDRVSTEDDLFKWFERVAIEFTEQGQRQLRAPPVEPRRRTGPVVLTVAGGVTAAVGLMLLIASHTDAAVLRSASITNPDERNAIADRGAALQLSGALGIAVGLSAAAVGVVLLLLGEAPEASSRFDLPSRALTAWSFP